MKKIFLLLIFITHLLATENPIGYFEQKDISKNLDILEQNFTHLDPKKSNFGFTKSIFWIKTQITNDTNITSKYVLHFSYTLLDYIDIYEVKNNQLIKKRETGDLRVYKNDGFLAEPTYFVNLEANEKKTFIIKVQTQGSMHIDLSVIDYEEYISRGIEKIQISMLYFGAVFIMLMYNFILYLYLRDKSYLYYVVFHLDFLFFTLAFNGLAFASLWPSLPVLNNFAIPFFMSMATTLAAIFVIDFLNIKDDIPKVYKLIKSMILISIVATFLILILSYQLATLIIIFISFIYIIIILAVSAYSHFISKNPNAKFFALAWFFLLMGVFIVHFKNLGLLPVNLFTSYAAFIGAFIELTLLSSALAYRYKLQKEEIVKKDITLLRQSRLASMGEMIANIAHQWRQPLHRINLSLAVVDSILKSDVIDKEMVDRKLKSSQQNLQYMSDTIDDFTNYFSADKVRESFNIYEIIQNAIKLLESRLKDIDIRMYGKEKVTVDGFKNEYLQVILVILNNAIDNFEIKSTKNPKIVISIDSNTYNIWIEISDNGGGIVQENIDRIFDPYYTTKFKDEGTGIGLYMAKMLIEQSMHGELSVLNNKKGATFMIKTEKGV